MREIKLYFGIVLGLGVLTACGRSGNTTSTSNEMETLLTSDVWRVSYTKFAIEMMPYALRFSENGQVFYLDSQGKSIFSPHTIQFHLSGDTLTIIDHRFNGRFKKKKGTSIYYVEEANTNEMVWRMLYPNSDNQVLLKKEE